MNFPKFSMNKFSVDSLQKDLEFCEKALNKPRDSKRRRFDKNRLRREEPKLSSTNPITSSQIEYPKKENNFRRKTREQLRHEHNTELEKECTFTPRINSYSSIRGKQSSFVDRLYSTKRRRDVERLKKEKEDEFIRTQCTFTPNTNPSHHGHRRNSRNTTVPPDFFDYLHHSNIERQRYLEQLRLQKDHKEMAECSFRPHIGLTTQTMLTNDPNTSKAPLFQRVGEVQRDKENYIKKLKIDREKQLDLNFQPSLNQKSMKILRQRDRSLANMRKYDKNERKRKIIDEQYKEYTFEPKVSKGSKKILREKEKFHDKDFFNRLELYEMEKKKRKIMKKKNDKSIFQYNVDLEKEEYKKKRNIRNKLKSDEAKEVFDRLALEDKKERDNRMRILERKYGLEGSFKPQTNKEYNRNVQKTDFHELVTNEAVEKKKRKARIAKVMQMKKELTFQPKLITRRKGERSIIGPDGSVTSISESMNKYRITDPTATKKGGVNMEKLRRLKNEKERERELRRRKQEKEKLKACTFQPNTHKSIVSYHKVGGLEQNRQPMYINGYQRFLAKCDHAKQIKEDKEKREFEVFDKWGKGKTKNWKKLNKRKTKKPDITVPKPFNLHEDNNYDTYEVKRLARMGNEKYETANCQYLFKN